ncbi:MAG: ferritin-like domain-containing protein [Bryobacteraceae bacterium]
MTGNPTAYTAADFRSTASLQGFGAKVIDNLFPYLRVIRDHEQAHVAALLTTIRSLGGTPVGPCTYNFPVTSIDTFLSVAQALENTGVSAYIGAAPGLKNPDLLSAAASIATVEARHAAFLNLLKETSPFPSAFDMPKTMQEILQIAAPFLGACPSTLRQTIAVVTPNMMTTNQASLVLDASASTAANGQPLNYQFAVAPGGKVPAILQSANNPKATIQFVNGAGVYPLVLTVTDSTGKAVTQNIQLTYQP